MSTPTFPKPNSAVPPPEGGNKDPMSKASDLANQAADKVSELGREAADKASEFGKDAVDRLDANRGTVARGLDQAAEAIRSNAPESVAAGAQTAADAVQRAAEYIRSRDLKSMTSDLTATVRQNPGPSMIAAVAVGFLLGVTLRRRD